MYSVLLVMTRESLGPSAWMFSIFQDGLAAAALTFGSALISRSTSTARGAGPRSSVPTRPWDAAPSTQTPVGHSVPAGLAPSHGAKPELPAASVQKLPATPLQCLNWLRAPSSVHHCLGRSQNQSGQPGRWVGAGWGGGGGLGPLGGGGGGGFGGGPPAGMRSQGWA